MAIEASIVIPTYNRYPLNLLTLFSLEAQTYDPSRFEVVLVDDASTDATSTILERHQFPFEIQYIRLPHNVGRPRARNIGIGAARGTHLIFLDAEILVDPGFVEAHMSLHLQHDRLVAGGVLALKRVYTRVDPGFSPEQQQDMISRLQQVPDLYAKWQATAHLPDPPPLFDRQAILEGRFRDMAFPTAHAEYAEVEVFQRYGDRFQGFHLPWIMSSTGNLSVPRAAIEQYGAFEEYDGYGWDDIELGYRLYLQGYQFAHIRHVGSYHQEHPVGPANMAEAKHNFFRFQQKYKEISLLVYLLAHIPGIFSLNQVNMLLDELYRIGVHEHPYRFVLLTGTLRSMLEAVGYLDRFDQPITNLLQHAGITSPSPAYDQFIAELKALEETGGYPHVTTAIHKLMIK